MDVVDRLTCDDVVCEHGGHRGCQASPLPVECPPSRRADGRHAWRFDGDDPYVICAYCDEMRDAHTDRAVRVASIGSESWWLATVQRMQRHSRDGGVA